MKKKLLSILVATTLLLTCIPLGVISVSAATNGTYNGMTYEIIEDEVTITGYTDNVPSNLTIPDTIEGYPVTTIGDSAFLKCVKLNNVYIPESVTSISRVAFGGCTSLVMINIPSHLTFIGYNAFASTSITSITIPDSVQSIQGRAFYQCASLENIVLPDRGINFGADCFTGTAYSNNTNNWTYFYGGTTLYIGKHLLAVNFTNYIATTIRVNEGTLSIAPDILKRDSTIEGSIVMYIPKSVAICHRQAMPKYVNWLRFEYEGNQTEWNIITNGKIVEDDHISINCSGQPFFSDNVTHSVMDTAKGNGLAFRFELSAKGVVRDAGNVVDLSNATVNYLGKDCKLIAMGAVLTNNAEVGATAFTLKDVNGDNVLNIPTVYLQEADEDSCAFATRIINIPDNQLERIIYARPYYIVEVDGAEITVYGNVNSATCAEYM